MSPWMKELKLYIDNDMPLTWDPPSDMEYNGGKHDDITVTVAQVFKERAKDDPRHSLAANDKFFSD